MASKYPYLPPEDEEELRTLEEICTKQNGSFYKIVAGNLYCGLAWTRRVDCKYCSKEKDHNGLYTCEYEEYKNIRDMLVYGEWNGEDYEE